MRMLFAGALMAATTITGNVVLEPTPVEAQGCADSHANYCALICAPGLRCPGPIRHRYYGAGGRHVHYF